MTYLSYTTTYNLIETLWNKTIFFKI